MLQLLYDCLYTPKYGSDQEPLEGWADLCHSVNDMENKRVQELKCDVLQQQQPS